MPLDRASVTVASRVMLPAYVALATVYGLVYLFDPADRLRSSHALAYPRAVMGGSMKPWGWLFLALALVLLVALRSHERQAYILGLCVCAAAWLGWACLSAISVRTDPAASLLSPIPSLFYFTASIASVRSLLTRES
jgi:hypothetical protein